MSLQESENWSQISSAQGKNTSVIWGKAGDSFTETAVAFQQLIGRFLLAARTEQWLYSYRIKENNYSANCCNLQ